MKTITAVELRKNMGEIFRRVQNGEEIAVTYRDQSPLRISVLKPKNAQKGKSKSPGLDALLEAQKLNKKPSKLDPNKSFEELYHEHLEEKYGEYVG